jgi:hypothetical protein
VRSPKRNGGFALSRNKPGPSTAKPKTVKHAVYPWVRVKRGAERSRIKNPFDPWRFEESLARYRPRGRTLATRDTV